MGFVAMSKLCLVTARMFFLRRAVCMKKASLPNVNAGPVHTESEHFCIKLAVPFYFLPIGFALQLLPSSGACRMCREGGDGGL